MMNDIKVGVIGIGNMGSAHASCILKGQIKGMVLTAVCDIDRQQLDIFKESYDFAEVYTDYHEFLNRAGIDAVIIAVPHPLHAEIAIEALEKGYHVMLEKPADISVSRVAKLNKIAQQSNKVFGIMFNQRTNPLFQRAREIVQGGQLGQLKRTVWIVTNWYRTQAYYDSGEWRATWNGEGGGVLLNQAPHNLDLWQWICGMPEKVTAFCDVAKYHDIEVEDDVTIITQFPNGAMGTFITTTGEFPGTNRLEISGDLGKIVLENGLLKWWKLKSSEREICKTSQEEFAQIEYDYAEIRQEEQNTGHQDILQNFTNAILTGEQLIAPGIEGIYELTLSNAAYLSSWKGNQAIQLPFDMEEFDNVYQKIVNNSKNDKNNVTNKLSDNYKQRWQVNW